MQVRCGRQCTASSVKMRSAVAKTARLAMDNWLKAVDVKAVAWAMATATAAIDKSEEEHCKEAKKPNRGCTQRTWRLRQLGKGRKASRLKMKRLTLRKRKERVYDAMKGIWSPMRGPKRKKKQESAQFTHESARKKPAGLSNGNDESKLKGLTSALSGGDHPEGRRTQTSAMEYTQQRGMQQKGTIKPDEYYMI